MKRIFTSHPVLKILSVGLAFFLWILVHGEKHDEVRADVEVEVANLPEDLVISNEFDQTINLRVAGPRTRLSQIKEGYFKPYPIDLIGAKPGVMTFSVHESDFSIPRRTRIKRIFPQLIRLRLDRAESRVVRVVPRFLGQLEEGFQLVAQDVDPPFVKVRGPAKEMSRVTTLRTEPISLAGRQATFDGVFSLQPPNQAWRLETSNVTIRMEIAERNISKILENVPVVVAGAPGRVKIAPAKVSLKIRGPAGKVASLMDEGVEVEIDASALGLGKGRKRTVQVHPVPPLRPGIKITLVPDNVRITLLDK